ncbi:energy transducer TonB [Permianibacter aggregans]|uniref:Protein TonB n=1 Tax=Permianibacter aggregans TaxID=1510150 RepID=A0A4R6V185_9GAMM|nr:energy transducer TonB [Permianibacter aggregans]QGX39475.1 energy transducer TonB [Permianibacter aggregans]TDQ49784.1 protein TonB [Permianibacter aggregans]
MRLAIVSFVVVFGLHSLALAVVLRPVEPELIPPKPLPVRIAMVTPNVPEPIVTPPPPQPKPEPPKPEPKPEPVKKPAPKPIKQPEPVATTEPVIASAPVTPSPVVADAPPVVAPVISEPRFDAGYLNNPAPEYPSLSRKRGEQGTVLLRVHVLPDGLPDQIELAESSGFSRLDKAAMRTVNQWRFVPAQQGSETVAAWVLVPVTFELQSES